MGENLRKRGIDIIGDTSLGTHFCQFYQTKEDLIDILVPYFKAGLEGNEFCMWITSEPLEVEEARASLKRVVKNLEDYVEKGQIEILDYSQWYIKSGKVESDKVLAHWVEKENQAIKRGFDGLRLTGNTFWLEETDWRDFTQSEKEINSVIGTYRMTAICSYSLDKCGVAEVMDVMSNHQFAVIKRKGKWEVLESSERKRAEEMLRESDERMRLALEGTDEGLWDWDVVSGEITLDDNWIRILGYDTGEMNFDFDWWDKNVHPDSKPVFKKALNDYLEGLEKYYELEYQMRIKSGEWRWIWARGICMAHDNQGKPLRFIGTHRDITERKQTEEILRTSNCLLEILAGKDDMMAMLRESVSELKNFTGCAAVGIRLLDEDGSIPYQAYDGFSCAFCELESPLLINSDKCICINIIKRMFDSKLPFYTEGGSFYTNRKTDFLASVSQEEKGKTLNMCNEAGYESVALVPIRLNREIVGLFHVADPKEDMVPLGMVEALERFGRQLGSALLRIRSQDALKDREQELRNKSKRLEEVNTALNVMLKKRDEDKLMIEEKVLFNVKELIEPVIGNLKNSGLDENQTGYVDILKTFLADIVSPFSQTLHTKFPGLTLSEIRVANLIKEGKTTKEIAGLLNSTPRAIEFHRQNVRKKVGLSNRKANLASHLCSHLK